MTLTPIKRAYLAGPMRGYADFNFPQFHAAAAALRAAGWLVFSPAERDIAVHGEDVFASKTGDLEDIKQTGFSLREALAADTQYIALQADAVIVLPDWQRSSGAVAETALAKALGLPVIEIAAELGSWDFPAERVS
jgi:nucleoside 2-deoxyribosyltransferase